MMLCDIQLLCEDFDHIAAGAEVKDELGTSLALAASGLSFFSLWG